MTDAAPPASIQVFDPRFDVAAEVAGPLERLCTGAIWSEGPIWMHEDGSVLWSDIPNNRMLRWHADDGMQVWREKVEFTNGHTREADGSLLHCSHGQRALVRTRFAGPGLAGATDEIVVDRYQGRRFNSPNDVVVKSDGTIWFSDPPYGIVSDYEGHKSESELGQCFVFRFDPATGALDIVSNFLQDPNGLAFSPDESILYVSDTSAARHQERGNHHIVAFDVIGGRTLANPRVFAVIDPGLSDGFRLDERGWLYTSSADSIQVYHPDGTRLAAIPVPEKVGNLTFGGVGRDEMYICASSSLYRIRLKTRGIQAP